MRGISRLCRLPGAIAIAKQKMNDNSLDNNKLGVHGRIYPDMLASVRKSV
jgi:hypothetical protein